MTRTGELTRGQRGGVHLLCVGLLAVLLLGAFHPLGQAHSGLQHACARARERHVEAPGQGDPHDEHHCSFCHLTRHVQAVIGPAPPPLAARVPFAAAPAAPRPLPPASTHPTPFCSRAPPAA